MLLTVTGQSLCECFFTNLLHISKEIFSILRNVSVFTVKMAFQVKPQKANYNWVHFPLIFSLSVIPSLMYKIIIPLPFIS